MRRKACALLMSATLGGCMSFDGGPGNTPACTGSWGPQNGPPPVPGVAGPHGQHVPMAQPYASNPPGNAYVAQQMMSRSVPLDMVQINRGVNAPGMTPGMMPGMTPGMSGPPGAAAPLTPIPPGGVLSPPGLPFAPGVPAGPNITPASFMQGSPGLPGSMNPAMPQGPSGGIMTAQYAIPNPAMQGHPPVAAQRTQIRFVRPPGMRISWFTQGPDGRPAYSNIPLEAPARYNFPQAAIYRLKLSNIEARPGLEIYPTMEVVPSNPKTDAFLAHSSVPLEFTQEDFKQVVDGNYVTKVIYLPDPQFQDVAGTGIDEIVSTRLEPGADPIQEALRRGSILLIIRMGNVDQEAPNTPPLGAVSPLHPLAPGVGPHGPHGPGGPHAPGHAVPPGFQVPYIGNRPILPPMPGGPMMPPGGPRSPLTPPPPPGLQLPPAGPLGAGLPPRGSFAPPAPPAPSQLVPPPLTPGAAPITIPSNPFNSSVPSGLTPPSTPLPSIPPSSAAPSTNSLLPPTGSIATPATAAPSAAPKIEQKADVPPLPSVPPIPNTSSRGPIVPTPTTSKANELPAAVAPPAMAMPGPSSPQVMPTPVTPNVVVPAKNEGPVNVPVVPAVGLQPDVVVPPPLTPTTQMTPTPTTQRPELPTIITPEQPAATPLPTVQTGPLTPSAPVTPIAPMAPVAPVADIHVPAPAAGSLPAIPSADLPPLPMVPTLPVLPAAR